MNDVRLVGAYASPYSRKMRAVLRYRRIPFRWIPRGSRADVGIPHVPVALIPVLAWSGPEGDAAMIDSTFQIERLERAFSDHAPEARSLGPHNRSIKPADPALAFLAALVEDYADEWVTKAMYHYRWAYGADAAKASHVLPCDQNLDLPRDNLARAAAMFSERQIGRLGVVGSTPATTPVIEASYRRLLALLDAQLLDRPFVVGHRPSAGDFALYGQLSQLAQFDPTSAAVAAEEAPRVVAWINWVDDLGWLADPTSDEWTPRASVGATLRPLLIEIGRVYAPFLLANAAALAAGAAQVSCTIDGTPYAQTPFPYQGKCLRWLREAHAALGSDDRALVDAALAGTGCDALFHG
jgi:glutathione S-transferase